METETHTAEVKSKSQIKRELHLLHELGKQLVALPPSQLRSLELTEQLQTAIMDARRFKRGALKRQLQYIAALMREVDAAAVQQALDGFQRPQQQEVEALHEVEAWRDALLAGDEALLDELVRRFQHADRQHLRQLVRNANRERQLNKPPKSARALFRELTALRADSCNP
ncbi:MAG: ribosome biogenesis factor YjgA [Pseudomonadota bacterium]|nr:ribosome biogenesis factor YjgA [Pseudomonadota bacterium]